MWNYKYILLFATLLLLFTGCKDRENEPTEEKKVMINLCLPLEGATNRQKRVIGDPGRAETFNIPRYLYIVVMKEVEGVWSVWRKEERILEEEEWVTTRYKGGHNTLNDSIFLYNKPIQFILNNETPQGRVYAICSKKKLKFNKSIESLSTLDDVINWTFETAQDTIQENLQDIYSTPYNYSPGGRYYCSYNCSAGNTSIVDLILYHVAAKVDIKWSVDKEKRINKNNPSEAVRITKMKACKLFKGNAYCFKPMENSSENPLDNGKEITIVQSTDEGLWWEGRSYFYTIPYTTTAKPGYYPLQMQMATNGSGDHNRTIYLQVNTSSPFVPWLRATFNLDKPLEEGTGDEITVDN